jgi:hypothetical protein
MNKIEINLNDFNTIGTNLISNESCIVIVILDTCITCSNYMAALDAQNINYKYIVCNSTNMPIITRIAKQLQLTTLAVPIVLRYKNGIYNSKLSNKIADIKTI